MTAEEWHPDIEVTQDLVQQCITQQFPGLAPLTSIKFIGQGWDNKVYLINDNFIFRFPQREIAVDLITRENHILEYLQTIINLQIPNPKYIGQPCSLYPYAFHGYKIINGISGCHVNLTTAQREASLIPLTQFLKQLHNIDATKATAMGAKPQVFDRMQIDRIAKLLNERVNQLINRKICTINLKCLQHEINLAKLRLPTDDNVLVHGDLYCRHLFFQQQKLIGIIDWGDNGINNRTVDLSIIFSFYDSNCHSDFFKLYGEVESNTWQYARFLGLYSALTVMLYGDNIQDNLLVKETYHAIQRINPDILA